MTWNYRIIHHDKIKHPFWAIHEVYYRVNGFPYMYSTEPIDLILCTKEDLDLGDIKCPREQAELVLGMITIALDKTILKKSALDNLIQDTREEINKEMWNDKETSFP
jgi:hypothetical protein